MEKGEGTLCVGNSIQCHRSAIDTIGSTLVEARSSRSNGDQNQGHEGDWLHLEQVRERQRDKHRENTDAESE